MIPSNRLKPKNICKHRSSHVLRRLTVPFIETMSTSPHCCPALENGLTNMLCITPLRNDLTSMPNALSDDCAGVWFLPCAVPTLPMVYEVRTTTEYYYAQSSEASPRLVKSTKQTFQIYRMWFEQPPWWFMHPRHNDAHISVTVAQSPHTYFHQ